MSQIRERLERRRLGGLWYYTFGFIGLMLVVMAVFYYFDRSFIWTPDGEDVYFVIMRYSRDYIIRAAKGLLQTGKLTLPAWDFAIGQGNNVLVGLHFNPFFLLSLPAPARFQEYAYDLIAIVQLYCAGGAMILLCRRVGLTQPFSTAMGALVYTFSGFAFHAAYSHIYFVSYLLLLLPLILAAAERYLQQRRWGCFVAVIAMTMLCGYYYAYIDTLLMTVYLVIRQLCVNGKDLKKSFFELMRLFLYYLLGFALSMAYFLPSVMNYFICTRLGGSGGDFSLLYAPYEYKQMLAAFASPQFTGDWTQLSFFAIALVSLTLVFVRRERKTLTVRAAFVVLTVFMCLPFAGRVFNGFGYVSNRWCFGYALCVAMATAYGIPALKDVTPREMKITAVVSAIWAVASVLLMPRYEVVVGVVLLGLTLLAAFAPDRSREQDRRNRRVAAVTLLAGVVSILIFFLPPFQDGIDDYRSGGGMNGVLARSAEYAAKNIQDDSFYRVEVPASRTNRFALARENGVSSYWSALPGKMTDYYQSFELASVRMSYALWGMDRALMPTTLSSVKYFLYAAPGEDEAPVLPPYGYEPAGTVKGKSKSYLLFENKYALPIGYTYSAGMTEAEFDRLNPIQRQQAMMQCAVLDRVPDPLAAGAPQLSAKQLEFTVADMNKVKQKDDNLYQFKEGGVITLTFEAQPNCETWVYLNGLSSGKRAKMTVTCGDVSRTTELYREGTIHYFPREGVAYNLGCDLEGVCTCTIEPSAAGKYSMGIEVWAMPMEDYARDAETLGQQVLEDVQLGTDTVSGRIHLDQPRLLVLTIPHIGGWRGEVDGKPQELLEVNKMYMGLMLDAGEHTIRLRYELPGLREGAAVSAVAGVGLCIYGTSVSIFKRKKRNGDRSK